MNLLFEGDSRDGVTSLVITLSAVPLICSGHYDFVVRLWSIQTKQLLMALEGHTDYVGSVAAWKGREPVVVSGSTDGTIKAWNTQSGSLLATGEGHTRDAWAVAVTTGPHPLIVSGSFDRTIRVWDINPVLADINWRNRKSFCLFLRYSGFLPDPITTETTSISQASQSLSNLSINSNSLQIKLDGQAILRSEESNKIHVVHTNKITKNQNKKSHIFLKLCIGPLLSVTKVYQNNSLCRQIASFL
jgi:WD40 repeat protein